MNTPRLIVTHGGKAHTDEFLAICVISAKFGETTIPIVRRDPTDAELDNPDIWVVDIGGRHEPELSNFDHHQFSRDDEPRCALSLVLDHFGLRADWRKIYGWLEVTEYADVHGPAATAQHLGISVENYFKTISPIEKAILKVFERETEGMDSDDLFAVIGDELVLHADEYVARLKWLREFAEIKRIPGLKCHYIWIPRYASELTVEDPSLAMREFRSTSGKDIPVSVTPDPRGEGYGLFRFDDDARVDFTRLDDNPNTEFVHRGGFYATTPTTDSKVLDALVAEGCGVNQDSA